MFKLEYFDVDGDVCEQEFSTLAELDEFVETLPEGWAIGVAFPDIGDSINDGDSLAQAIHKCIKNEIELRSLTQYFPPNKVN